MSDSPHPTHREDRDHAEDYLQRAQRCLFEAVPLRVADRNPALLAVFHELQDVRRMIQGVRDKLRT